MQGPGTLSRFRGDDGLHGGFAGVMIKASVDPIQYLHPRATAVTWSLNSGASINALHRSNRPSA